MDNQSDGKNFSELIGIRDVVLETLFKNGAEMKVSAIAKAIGDEPITRRALLDLATLGDVDFRVVRGDSLYKLTVKGAMIHSLTKNVESYKERADKYGELITWLGHRHPTVLSDWMNS